MLSQTIQSAAQFATQIVNSPGAPGAGQTAQADAQSLLQRGIPAFTRLQQDILQFATTANLNVTGMISALQGGTPASALVPQLQAMSAQAVPINTEASSGTTLSAQIRDQFSQDSAQLQTEQQQLQGQAASLGAQSQQLQQQAASIQARIDLINKLALINPLIKVIDELASVIESGKSTEAQLNSTNQQLAAVQAQVSQLQSLAQQTGVLETGTGQLAGGVQSMANVLNMVISQLQNESQFEQAANAQTAVLYLQALQSNTQNLQQIAQ